VVTMKNSVFGDVMLFGSCENRRFGGGSLQVYIFNAQNLLICMLLILTCCVSGPLH
jgi:hypothetical protein